MSEIGTWLKSLVVFYLLLGFFWNVVPKEHYRKYIRFYGGLVFSLSLFGPLLSVLTQENIFETTTMYEEYLEKKAQGMKELEGLEENTQAYEEAYQGEVISQGDALLTKQGIAYGEIEVEYDADTQETNVRVTGVANNQTQQVRILFMEYFQLEEGQVVVDEEGAS